MDKRVLITGGAGYIASHTEVNFSTAATRLSRSITW